LGPRRHEAVCAAAAEHQGTVDTKADRVTSTYLSRHKHKVSQKASTGMVADSPQMLKSPSLDTRARVKRRVLSNMLRRAQTLNVDSKLHREHRQDKKVSKEELARFGFVKLKRMVSESGLPLPKFVNKESLIDCILNGSEAVTPRTRNRNKAKEWKLRPNQDKPHLPIDQVDWTKAMGCHRSDTGHGGVFFVKLPTGIIVLKSCADMAQQLFASTLINWIGIPSAKCRLLNSSSKEGKEMLMRLKTINREASYKLSRMRYVLVFEFVPGKALKYMRPNDYKQMLLKRAINGEAKKQESCMTASCRTMGRLSALDALLYYDADRLPIVCHTKGNGGNIILGPGDFKVTAIDNGANFIDTSTAVGKQRADVYFRDTEETVKQFVNNPHRLCKSMERVKKMIARYSNWDATDSFLILIQNGFIEGARDIVKIFPNLLKIKTLYSLISRVRPEVPGIRSLNIDFISKLLTIFQRTLGKHGGDFKMSKDKRIPTVKSPSTTQSDKPPSRPPPVPPSLQSSGIPIPPPLPSSWSSSDTKKGRRFLTPLLKLNFVSMHRISIMDI